MSGVRVLVLGVGLALAVQVSRIGISGISSCSVTPNSAGVRTRERRTPLFEVRQPGEPTHDGQASCERPRSRRVEAHPR